MPADTPVPGPGVLVLGATPIGNVGDASPRLRAELASADIVAAEDTRRARRLAAALDVSIGGRIVSYYDANENARTAELVSALAAGQRVLLVTDAGLPSVSDPGYRLVAAAVVAQVRVTVLPGPSAVLSALAVSGLPVDRFCFEGFLPRRSGERSRRLAELAAEPRTLVFFEAPHRLAAMLAALASAFGVDRPAAVCRELTKTYEEVRRGTLESLADWAAEGVRGEVTVVVQGADARSPGTQAASGATELARRVEERIAGGLSRRDAITTVAAELGLPRKVVYAAGVADSPGAP